MSVRGGGPGWQVIPYVGKTSFKRVRVRDDVRIRAIVRHLQAHECVALIGPPFSEKSRLLDDVAESLELLGLYRTLCLDLWHTDSSDEAACFTSLGAQLDRAMGRSGLPRKIDAPLGFQNFLVETVSAQPYHTVLLIDHLQALPSDLIHSLLLALRAAYMELAVGAPRQLAGVVSGGMNLVGLSTGPTSPFNIAKPVVAAPLDTDQSLALAAATLEALGCHVSSPGLERIVQWAGGDRYLLPRLCGATAEVVQDRHHQRVNVGVVERAAIRLVNSGDLGAAAPLIEAIRAVEEDPDTMLDVLDLLRQETLPRSRARQMPTRTGVDRLQLSGAVLLSDGVYRIKNLAFHLSLKGHFTAERVGHVLRSAGCWSEAISYLAPQVQEARDPSARAQLLEATVQSIYASDSLVAACELLAQGIERGFGRTELAVYRALPTRASLELVRQQGHSADHPPMIDLRERDSVAARTYELGGYALRSGERGATLIATLSAGGRRLGLVVAREFAHGRKPQELPPDLPALLHFLGDAAGALESVIVRAAFISIGQAVLASGAFDSVLNTVLEDTADALGCESANLYMADPSAGVLAMVAGVGQVWTREYQASARLALSAAHPAADCLRGRRMLIAGGSDERLPSSLVTRYGLGDFTWVYLPLVAGGEGLGTLELGFRGDLRLASGEESRSDLQAFANQVAIAVHNMQLLRRTDEALAARAAELARLRSSSLAISAALDVPTALSHILSNLSSLYPGSHTTLWKFDPDTETLGVAQSTVTAPEYLQARLDCDSPLGRAIASGHSLVVDSVTTGAEALPSFPRIVAVPLISHDKPLGALGLYPATPMPAALPAGTLELLEAFAAHAAVVIENATLQEERLTQQRLEQELKVAREVQRSLLPLSIPQIPGWQFASVYRAARVVGGDFYDFCMPGGSTARLGIVIADVSDKGIPAAIFMAMSRTILRTMALSGRGPAAALSRANDLILNDARGDTWLTAVYAVLETGTGRLIYANAGHNRPLWYRAAQREVVELDARGILLGAFDNVDLAEERLDLAPGDLLLFYTDGITEAMDPAGQLFDEGRLVEVLARHAHEPAAAVLDAIVSAVTAFAGTAEQSDDITCVVVKREG